VTEEVLCGIWSEVLRVERVGVHDNFFELGGDSILSIQIIAKIQEQGFHCSIQDLFERPEIAELAALLDQRTMLPEEQERLTNFSLVREEDRRRLPEEIEDAYPLAMLQAGMIFHSEYAPHTTVYHDLLSYHLNAPLDIEAMRATTQELIKRHAVLRTSFAVSSYSEPLQLVHRIAEMPIEVQDISALSESEQREVIRQTVESEKNRDFQWTQPPLMRLLESRSVPGGVVSALLAFAWKRGKRDRSDAGVELQRVFEAGASGDRLGRMSELLAYTDRSKPVNAVAALAAG
jgi:microcystin synthetase protein McyA